MNVAVRILANAGFLAACALFLHRWLIAPTPSPGPSCLLARKGACPRRQLALVFAGALALRLAMLCFGALALGLKAGGTGTSLLSALSRWDGTHYINLSTLGYSGYTEDGQHLFLVFFPLYPWLIRLLSFLTGSPAISGLAISLLCYALGCAYLYRLAFERFGQKTAALCVALLFAFPFSFYYGAVMTEGLYLLCSCAALYGIHRRKWLAAGLWGAAAALTRMAGLLLAAAMLVELVQAVRPKTNTGAEIWAAIKKGLKKLPFVLLPFAGTLTYLLLNLAVDGSPFAFLTHQGHWYQQFSWFSETLVYHLGYIAGGESGFMLFTTWLPQLLLFILFFSLLLWALVRRRGPCFLAAYAFLYLIVNFSLSWLLSGGRYLSCGAPFFLYAASLLGNRPLAKKAALALSAVLLGIYYTAYLYGSHLP